MLRLALPPAATPLTLMAMALPLLALSLVTAPAAHAGSLVCQSVNGQSVCSQDGDSLSCQTVNGRTVCLEGSGQSRCETVNGRTTCTTSRTEGAASRHPRVMPPVAMPPMPPMLDDGQDLSVEQGPDGHLRVRAGGVDVRID